MKDSVFEGFGGGPTPWAAGGEVAVEPGRVSSQVAFAGPHLVDASSQKLCEAHE